MPGRPASRVAHSNCECIAHGRQCCELGVERCLAIQRLVLHTAVSQNATRGNNVAIAATRCRKSCRGEPSQDQLSPAMAQPPQAKLLSYEIHYTAFLLSVADCGFSCFHEPHPQPFCSKPRCCHLHCVQRPVSSVQSQTMAGRVAMQDGMSSGSEDEQAQATDQASEVAVHTVLGEQGRGEPV